MTEQWVARCYRVGVDVDQVEGRRCPECGDPDGHREPERDPMTEAIKKFDAARLAFLEAVKALTTDTEAETLKALSSAEEHDYLKYLATRFGALGHTVASHTVLSFEAWKRLYCGGRRACEPKKALEDH